MSLCGEVGVGGAYGDGAGGSGGPSLGTSGNMLLCNCVQNGNPIQLPLVGTIWHGYVWERMSAFKNECDTLTNASHVHHSSQGYESRILGL